MMKSKMTVFAVMLLALTAQVHALTSNSVRFDARTSFGGRLATGVELLGSSDGSSLDAWDTTAEQDGWQALESGNSSVDVCVLNTTATVHEGRLASDETWSAGVHVVRSNVVVPSGKALTLASGAIVKFTEGASIIEEGSGAVVFQGAQCADIADDNIGGDTNFDSSDSSPTTVASDWFGDGVSANIVSYISESGDVESMHYYSSGIALGTLPTPTKDGYTFLGWFTAAEGGDQVTVDTVVTADMTLYAHWEAVTIEPQWTIDENGVLTSVELNGAAVAVIPDGVTSIGDKAFYECDALVGAIIPNSVTNIGYCAFYGCKALIGLVIPDSVISIGSLAFGDCSALVNIILPAHLKCIEFATFVRCASLESLTIPASVTEIDYYAFKGCSSLMRFKVNEANAVYKTVDGLLLTIDEATLVACPEGKMSLTIPDKVKVIGEYAVSDCCNLTTINIPSSVTNIGYYAFEDSTNLRVVTGGEGLKRVGYGAFDGTLFLWGVDSWDELAEDDAYQNGYGLEPVYLGNFIVGLRGSLAEAWNDEYYDEDGNWIWQYDPVIRDGTSGMADYLFEDLPITSVTIPEGVTRIPDGAFRRTLLYSVELPSTLSIIGHYTFEECQNLTEIEIPSRVRQVGINAFDDCENLRNAIIPQSLCEPFESEEYSYYGLSGIGCGGVTNLVIHSGVTNIGEAVFSGLCNLQSVTIPEGVVNIGDSAFHCCCSLLSVTLPSTVTNIGAEAFSACFALESIVIPEGVVGIGDYAFCYCENLKAVSIPSTVTNIGAEAFSSCSALESIVIPEGVVGIGDYAFGYCENLKAVSIPSTVTYVGYGAFDGCGNIGDITVPQVLCEPFESEEYSYYGLSDIGCYGVTNLVIHSGVTNIGEAVFSDLCNLQSVTIPEGVVNIGDSAFHCCCSLLSVTLPSTVTNIGADAFSSCSALESIVIPEGVVGIGDYAFCYCVNLKAVSIPSTVTNIGAEAFSACFALESIVIPESVVTIGGYAFSGCENLTYAKVPLALKEQVEQGEVFADCSPDLQIEYYEVQPLALPVITPADGSEFYEDSCTVTISCETEGASIYYTTDGTTPRPRPANLYTGPFEIADTTTVKAIAVKGDERTDLVSATIVRKEIVLAAPVITPADGTEFYEDSCMVTISCATEGASIYYVVCDTNNVTNPRPSDRNLYTGPFTVSATKMVRAFSMFGSKASDIVSATLIKRELTLPVAVDAPELTFATGGDAKWTPEFNGSANVGGSLAQSGALSWSMEDYDPSETWMETTVAGAGTFSFWWKVDCEDDPFGCTWDRFEVYTNGVEAARIDGKTEWEKIEFTFADSRTHTVRWRFCKDDWDDEKLTDLAWVDGVVWTPVLTDITVDVGGGKTVVVPASWIDKYGDILAAAGGDKMAALLRTAANGRKVWECFVLGVDPTKADDDFRITRFWMDNGKPMFEFSHSVDGAGNSFTPRIKTKGKAKLSDGWSDVPTGGAPSFRFFTVEVMLP